METPWKLLMHGGGSSEPGVKDKRGDSRLAPKATRFDRTSTSFMHNIGEYMKNVKWGDDLDYLKYYQNITRCYVSDVDIGTRGLLCYHTMGMGKSLLAISIAMDMLKDHKVILLLAKSLHTNMRETIHKYISMRSARDDSYSLGQLSHGDIEAWIDRHFTFVSMNAGNMLNQMKRATEGDISGPLDLLESKLDEVLKLPTLDGNLIIVDEAHILFRSITNGSKNALRFYDAVMKSRNVRLLFCTGTPIASNPFEMVPCFNMLASRDGVPVLPEQYEEFMRLYVDEGTGLIRNKEKYANRLFGLVSHVSHLSTPGAAIGRTADDSASDIVFPMVLPLSIKHVPMGSKQYSLYNLARESEKNESTGGSGPKGKASSMTKPKSGKSSTYRTKSRQLSNYAPPNKYAGTKDVADIPAEECESKKFAEMAEVLDAHEGQLSIVYSSWVNIGGIAPFAKYLTSRGWKNGTMDKSIRGPKTFALITSDVEMEDRDALRREYCSPANYHGERISLLIISKLGAVGLDLKGVRVVLVMEPPWKLGDFYQIVARAARNGSHMHLPADEQNVQPYLFLSVAPDSETKEGVEPISTTDTEIYDSAKRVQVSIDSFNAISREIGIECMHNRSEGVECYSCAPTDERLFTPGIGGWWKDEGLPNPCKRAVVSKISASMIEHAGETYYYTPAPKRVFRYIIYRKDKKLGTHVEIMESDELFHSILATIKGTSDKLDIFDILGAE